MKIAIISEYNSLSSIGGTENYIDFLINGLSQKGHEVLLITLGKISNNQLKHIEIENQTGYQLFEVKKQDFSKDEITQKVISYTWNEIYPVLRNFTPEIIHVHTLSTFFNIKHIEICKNFFNTIVMTSHIPGHFCPTGNMIKYGNKPCNGKLNYSCNLCLVKSDSKEFFSTFWRNKMKIKLNLIQKLKKLNIHIICVSNWQKNQLILNEYDSNKISVIRQIYVSKNKEKPGNIIKNKRFEDGKITIGYLGRLSKEKGTEMLLKAIEKYKNHSTISFKIAIPSNTKVFELEKFKSMVTGYNNVEVDLTVNDKNKSQYFSKIDILYIPSYCIETGPIVLLEAVYNQKLVLAPNIGGPLEFSDDYPDNVICYKWNDITSVQEKIDSIQTIKMDMHNLDELSGNYNLDAFVKRHLEVYEMSY